MADERSSRAGTRAKPVISGVGLVVLCVSVVLVAFGFFGFGVLVFREHSPSAIRPIRSAKLRRFCSVLFGRKG